MFAAALALAGCARDDPAVQLGAGRASVAKGDYRTAIVQLKTSLQQSPANADARLLLGRSLLATGDVAGAQTELRKALELGAPADQVWRYLAPARAADTDRRAIAEELATVEVKEPEAVAQVAVARAGALIALGKRDEATQVVEAASKQAPADPALKRTRAELRASSGDLPGALKLLDEVLAADPKDATAIVLRSDLLARTGRREESIAALEAGAQALPDSAVIHFTLVSVYGTSGKPDLAEPHLVALQRIAPNDPRTQYGEALLAFLRHDRARAGEKVQQVLNAQPENLPALYLAALIDLDGGRLGAAEEGLRRVLNRIPGEPTARRALATTYLRSGRGRAALEVLQPALHANPDDPVLLRTAAEATLLTGDAGKAAALYEKANAGNAGSAATRVRAAELRAATGDRRGALHDLEALASSEGGGTAADLALVSMYVRQKDFDRAAKSIANIETRNPSSPLPAFLRGMLAGAKGDTAGARQGFEAAVARQPTYFPAVYRLGLLDLQDGRFDAARARYDALLTKAPGDEQALLALAELQQMTGAPPADIRRTLDRAIEAAPADPAPRLAIVALEIRGGNALAAMAAAQTAQGALPNDPAVVEALGRTQFAANEPQQAIETYKRLVSLAPESSAALLKLAEAQARVRDWPAAIEAARKAAALDPSPAPAFALARLFVEGGRTQEAIDEARRLQKAQPSKALGYVIEAEVRAREKKWAEAIAAARAGLTREPSPALAGRVQALLLAAGRDADAKAFATQWLGSHPDDKAMYAQLGQQAQLRGDVDGAIAQYRKAHASDPDNVLVLNNLAWLLNQRKDPAAGALAEQAWRLAPFSPAVLDTYAQTKLQAGDPARAVVLLRMATTLAPDDAGLRLNLARAEAKSGDAAAARRTLEPLSRLDRAPAVKEEAARLLREL